MIKGQIYSVESLKLVGWTQGDGSGSEGYVLSAYFDADGRYLGPDNCGIEPIVEAAEIDEEIEITESSLFVDGNQGTTKHDRAFGFVGTNATNDEFYQGWFFTYPGESAHISSQEEMDAVLNSLDADETHSNDPKIPHEWARARLEKFLQKKLDRAMASE